MAPADGEDPAAELQGKVSSGAREWPRLQGFLGVRVRDAVDEDPVENLALFPVQHH